MRAINVTILTPATAVLALVVSFSQRCLFVIAGDVCIPDPNGNFPALLGVVMAPLDTIS